MVFTCVSDGRCVKCAEGRLRDGQHTASGDMNIIPPLNLPKSNVYLRVLRSQVYRRYFVSERFSAHPE